MEQSKVVMYARFGINVSQKEVDYIKKKMDDFLVMIEAELVAQKWEILARNQNSRAIYEIIKQCSKNGWGILTYDLKTLHQHHSGAMSLIAEGDDAGVPVYFIEGGAVMQTLFNRL
tara:strand:+ start:163 stop:510 length:348 start_codon:yes stop_codon:yes gene_type:complete